MRITVLNARQCSFVPDLAKEIGLEASVALLALELEIAENGMDRDGQRMAARNAKQMTALLPWAKPAEVQRVLLALQNKNLLFIEDASLIERDSTKWYGINYAGVKKLQSVLVLGDGEIEEMHGEPEAVPAAPKKDAMPQLHRDLFPAVIKMSNLTIPLTPRDAGEVREFIKNLAKRYPDEDFGRLQRRVLGIRVWQESRNIGGEHLQAPRPRTAWSNWERYGQYCREHHGGNLPPIPAEWITETGRRDGKAGE